MLPKLRIESPDVPKFNPIAPYSTAIRAGEFLFITGQVATAADGSIVGDGDVREQVRQVFRNIGSVLSAAGATYENLVRLTYFYVDIDHVHELKGVREEFMSEPFPAVTGVQISRLADLRLLVEIEAVAWIP